MAIQLVRYLPPIHPDWVQPRWGVVFGERIAPLSGALSTTGHVLRQGQAQARHLKSAFASLYLDEVSVLSPITPNQRCLGQGRPQFGQHAELGLVLGRDVMSVSPACTGSLHELFAGIAIVPGSSATDVAQSKVLPCPGEGVPSFGPAGAYLLLLESDEWALWPQLDPALNPFLGELSGEQNLFAGDLIATGARVEHA